VTVELTAKDRFLARLARRTTSGRYIPEIDGLRFVAIVGVFLFHVAILGKVLNGSWVIIPPFGQIGPVSPSQSDVISRALSQGTYGVQLFFVVSGFVLALPFIAWRVMGAKDVSTSRYFLRRVTRIEPPYLVAMTLLFIVALITQAHVGAGHYLSSLLYLHQPVYAGPSTLNSVAWSLEVEIQFYFCVPILAILFSSSDVLRRRATIVFVCLLSTIFQEYGFGRDPRMGAFLGNFLQFFLVGWLLADLYVVSWGSKPTLERRWDLVSLLGWPLLISGLMASDRLRFGVVLGPWLLFALCVAALRGPITTRILRNRWVATIGGMCYSIYLLHYPLLIMLRHWTEGFSHLTPGFALLMRAAVYGPIVLLVSGVFFVLVERPCMDPRWPLRLLTWARRSPFGAPRPEPVA
jgi:peptidoglycan/LPS O-acetylase OafA/YrhL